MLVRMHRCSSRNFKQLFKLVDLSFFSWKIRFLFFKIFEQRPSAIEEFAKYASYLIPHKLELSANQQTIEYFSSLFEVKNKQRKSFVFVIFLSLKDHFYAFRSFETR